MVLTHVFIGIQIFCNFLYVLAFIDGYFSNQAYVNDRNNVIFW